jgi:hypothetical protein
MTCHDCLGNIGFIVCPRIPPARLPGAGLVRQFDRGGCHVHYVVFVAERLRDNAIAVQFFARRDEQLLDSRARHLELARPQVDDCRNALRSDRLLRELFDVPQIPSLARFGERDRHAGAAGPPVRPMRWTYASGDIGTS